MRAVLLHWVNFLPVQLHPCVAVQQALLPQQVLEEGHHDGGQVVKVHLGQVRLLLLLKMMEPAAFARASCDTSTK